MGSENRPGQTGTTVVSGAGWLVDRSRLTVRLDGVPYGGVLLIAAPAGYGKSTLLAQWTASSTDRPVAYIDGSDGDSKVLDERLAKALGLLAGERPTRDTVRACLDERIGNLPESTLVIDDCRSPEAWRLLDDVGRSVVSARGTDLRVIALSRARPTGWWSRELVTGGVDLLTEHDLAFSDDELVQVVELIAGEPIPEALLESVRERLGGWPAAVVGLARAWRTGTGRREYRTAAGLALVEDFIVSEILADGDADLLGILSDVVRLPLLSGELCDAATGGHNSGILLARLRAEGWPVFRTSAPEDGPDVQRERRWFRVHPLVREAIEARVPEKSEGRRTQVADAAIRWHRERGHTIEASRLLAGEARWDELKSLLQVSGADLLAAGRSAEIAEVIASAPAEVAASQGGWIMSLAALEQFAGNVQQCQEILTRGERWLNPARRMVADVLRSGLAPCRSDAFTALAAGEAALTQCDELGDDHEYDDAYNRSQTEHYRIIVRGNLLATGALVGAWSRVKSHRGPIDPLIAGDMPARALVHGHGQRALHLVLAGEMRAATRELDLGEQIRVDNDAFVDAARTPELLARGEIARSEGRPVDAVAYLAEARERAISGKRWTYVALAQAWTALTQLDVGAFDEAKTALGDESVGQVGEFVTVAGMIASARARWAAATGATKEQALAVATAVPFSSASALTTAELALRFHDRPMLERVLAQWPDEPTSAGRVRRGLVQAAAQVASGRRDLALEPLDRALALAARHDLVRPVVEMAPHLSPVLVQVAEKRRTVAGMCDKFLSTQPPPILRQRQESILLLMAQGHTLQGIANQLHMSVNTVKKDVQSIYRTLGVNSRADALAVWADRR